MIANKDRHAARTRFERRQWNTFCLLYTSDAADERSSVDLGGRRFLQKKTGHGERIHVEAATYTYSYNTRVVEISNTRKTKKHEK